MKSYRALICGFALLLGLLSSLQAQNTYVYTNNDVFGSNTVSAFKVNADNTLSLIPGSPFQTGGTGSGGGYFASNRIVVSVDGKFLFASNTRSNNVSVFSINSQDGVLTLLPGSPFATGGSGGAGISLAVSPNGKYLYASDSGSNTITAFSVSSHGSLSMIGFPVAAGGIPDGTKVTPDGNFLAVALVNADQAAMFDIGPDGSLTPVFGSPFTGLLPAFLITGVDINCDSNLLFTGNTLPAAAPPPTVQVFGIDREGVLGSVPGSPFQAALGPDDSNVVLLSPDNGTLFVSNQGTVPTGSITTFRIAADGSLSLVLGSPFPTTGGFFPSGMATSRDGTLLFVANLNSKVSAFTVASDGTLTQVFGSPFSTGQPSGLFSLAVWPPATCKTRNNIK